MQGNKVGLVGAGSMAEALIRGVRTAGQPQRPIAVCNRGNAARLTELAERWQVTPCAGIPEVAAGSDIVVLAVKPRDAGEAMAVLGPCLQPGQTLVSVAAGVPLAWLESQVAPGVAVVRAMPNTSCRVGAGATALAAGTAAGPQALADATSLFAAVGTVKVVPEAELDAVTGLSGTGPAYVYLLLEAMIDAGVQAGLDRAVAHDLAVQTIVGAAKMVLETGEPPAVLRQQVTSPGGTTQAAMAVLTERGFVPAVHAAVLRATARAQEMGAEVAAQFAAR